MLRHNDMKLTTVPIEQALDRLKILGYFLCSLQDKIGQSSCNVSPSQAPRKMKFLTFLRVSPPGAPFSSLGMASRKLLTMSGGVRGLVLKKFIVNEE